MFVFKSDTLQMYWTTDGARTMTEVEHPTVEFIGDKLFVVAKTKSGLFGLRPSYEVQYPILWVSCANMEYQIRMYVINGGGRPELQLVTPDLPSRLHPHFAALAASEGVDRINYTV